MFVILLKLQRHPTSQHQHQCIPISPPLGQPHSGPAQQQTILALRGRSVWSMDSVPVLAEWRSSSEDSGAPSVTISGAPLMPKWYADSYAVAGWSQHHHLPLLDKAQDPSGWMMLPAWAMKQSSATADTEGLEYTTVAIMKTLVWSVKVRSHCFFKYLDTAHSAHTLFKKIDMWIVLQALFVLCLSSNALPGKGTWCSYIGRLSPFLQNNSKFRIQSYTSIFFVLYFYSFFPDPFKPADHSLLICGDNSMTVGVNVTEMLNAGLNPFSGNMAVNNCTAKRVSDGVAWYSVQAMEGACGNGRKVRTSQGAFKIKSPRVRSYVIVHSVSWMENMSQH